MPCRSTWKIVTGSCLNSVIPRTEEMSPCGCSTASARSKSHFIAHREIEPEGGPTSKEVFYCSGSRNSNGNRYLTQPGSVNRTMVGFPIEAFTRCE